MISFLARRWPWAIAAAAIVGVFLASSLRVGPKSALDARPVGDAAAIASLAQERPNLLFILVDTLRAEHLSAYGYARETSPFLARLAERGIRFEHHLAQSSWTKCSMASLWTGRYPARAGVIRFSDALPTSARLPAEIMREAGMRTVGIFRNGWVSGYHGFDQGFEVYARPATRPLPAELRRANPTVAQAGTDSDAMEMAAEFLRLNGRDRWFLYLHLMDLHEYLYDSESALFGTSNMDIYDNAIRRVDWVIQDFVEHLATIGQLEKTVIAIAADHGEAFGERGYEGHAREVYRETTEVPFLVSLPFRLEPGVVVAQRSANVDIWPTLLELIGMPPLDAPDGRSRLPAILAAARGEAIDGEPEPAFATLHQRWGWPAGGDFMHAVSLGSLRYVIGHNADDRPVEDLFYASSDTKEHTNLAASRPEELETMRELVRRYRESKPDWEGGVKTLEIDEMELNQLRALGYKLP
jgi:arylsulfatase A-like enzyme